MLRRFTTGCLLMSLMMLLSLQASAQLFYSGTEYGISAGGAHYFGDLNDNYGVKAVNGAAGIFVRQHLTPYISVRGALSYSKVGYDDALNDNPFNKMRNLSFRSDIIELAVQSEFNFTRFGTGEDAYRFTPYLTGGIGVFYFNPYTEFEGSRHYLRKLGTEGQNLEGYGDRKYNSISVCFPIGFGFKYWIKPGFNIGLEIADRLTFTDYLDDVSTSYVGADQFPHGPDFTNPAHDLQDRSQSQILGRPGKQRGNSQTRDQYMHAIINLSFQLKVYRCPGYLEEGILE